MKNDSNINWTEIQDKAFTEIKNKINDNIATYIPDYSKEFVLTTDASNTGIGGVLQQERDGKLQVIDWVSKKLTVTDNEGNLYYKNELSLRKIPFINERKEIIKKIHEQETTHRGKDAVINELKKEYFWINMEESVNNLIKNCDICAKNDQKKLGGANFMITENPLEIGAADLMFIDQNRILLTFIDYYTRLARAKIIESKESNNIKDALEEIFNEITIQKC